MNNIKTAKRLNNFSEYVFSKLGKVIKDVEAKSKLILVSAPIKNLPTH